uniref:Uncharacterized protein n=1 Tax=Anopheles melas TaxID=34690 RepID=A0A182U7P2_9DIPT
MLCHLLVTLALLDLSLGQSDYPNYPQDTYAYGDYGDPAPTDQQPTYEYPDYSYVETYVPTTTATPATEPTKKRQVFPPTPTGRSGPTRRQRANRIVRWYFMNDWGTMPVRATTVVRRRNLGRSSLSKMPPYYRSMLAGSRALSTNAPSTTGTRRIEYWYW